MKIILTFLLAISFNAMACDKPSLSNAAQAALNSIKNYQIYVGKNTYATGVYNDPHTSCFAQEDINMDGEIDYAVALIEAPLNSKKRKYVSVGILYSSEAGYNIKIHKDVAYLKKRKDGMFTNLKLRSYKKIQSIHMEDGVYKTRSPSFELSAIEGGGGAMYHWSNGKLYSIDLSH
jgi:hypothetical protein